MILLMAITKMRNIVDLFGSRGVLASVIFLIASIGMGWFLGGTGAGVKSVLALRTVQRNIAAALLVVGQNFPDPKAVVMIVVVAIVGMVLLMPFASMLARRRREQGAAQAAQKG